MQFVSSWLCVAASILVADIAPLVEGTTANTTTTTIPKKKTCASANLIATVQVLVEMFPECYEVCPEMCNTIQNTTIAHLTAPATAIGVACQQIDAWKCTVSDTVKLKGKTAKDICAPGAAEMKRVKILTPENASHMDSLCAPFTTTTTTTTAKPNNVSAANGLVMNMTWFASILLTLMAGSL
eukprot:TRINITY_DN51339_c0_g1_i1.p1 TRINITY_DN51339_c0_g1~~TRINITY_DN51339_c0_g1_i1.p1  ORF type:complete len:183 (+),score=22.82 TRINITY_DN51339_c0_g1_i1:99-647(+)